MDYVFGPVPSRRLGRSLGVDLVPMKTCTYDCIYCQLGATTEKTIDRKEWIGFDDVVNCLRERLATFTRESAPDYITLSGSGEPTLHSRLGELIEIIKGLTDVPVALITNGSLLWQSGVRSAIRDVDLIIPSLDAGDESRFRYINRPHYDLSFDQLMEGLIKAREVCRGEYWLEVMLLAGYTAIDSEVMRIAEWVSKIKPDRVQVNTVTRPPAESFAEPVPHTRLAELAACFNPAGEVICHYQHDESNSSFSASREEILTMLRRRPCSIKDIASGLGLHPNEVVKYVESLKAEQVVETVYCGGECYHKPVAR